MSSASFGGQRRLAAIMFTDLVGYTAVGQKDEQLSLRLLEEQGKIIRSAILRHYGREVKTMGDAFLLEFASALDALRCAYDIQRATREFNISVPEAQRIHLKIGIHLGEVVESQQGDIFGDAVNIASRIQTEAEDGGVCLTRQVFDQTHNKFGLPLVSIGEKSLKNVAARIELYKVELPWEKEQNAGNSRPQLDRNRVAVLPFANISADPADEYFSDGMTEELIDRLSQIKGIEVIARTSIMTYKKKEKKAVEIGRELSSGVLIEGSVRKAGNRIRVTAQFIDANTEAHLWSSKYDKNLEDIFAIQSDIAEQVAQSLTLYLRPNEKRQIEKPATTNADAHLLCLKARYFWNERARESNDKALRYYQQAIKIDPLCALAYSGVSDCYHIAGDYNYLRPEEAYPATKEYATKALEIDPSLAEAHTSLGAVCMHYEWKWDEAERELEKAVELRPSYPVAHQALSNLMIILRRFGEGLEYVKKAHDLDPLAKGIWSNYGEFLSLVGRNEEAVAEFKKLLEINPDFPTAHRDLGFVCYRTARYEMAVSELRRAVELSPEAPTFKADLGLILSLLGKVEEARSLLSQLIELSSKTYVSYSAMARLRYCLGDKDGAFEFFENAFQHREPHLPVTRSLPELESLAEDPGWISLERKMGLR